MTGSEKDCVEKMLTRFIEKSIKGVKSDYFRTRMKIYNTETSIETISETEELVISRDRGICAGFCSTCGKAALCEAMLTLTEKQRFVIEKRFVDQYTENEIARMLGLSQQTVHYHKIEAVNKLRSTLSKRQE